MKIFLNPGHDRELDSGAVNPNNGAREADVVWRVTMEVANNIAELLSGAGHVCRTMQSNDLGSVVWAANNWPADLFISIHCNGFNTIAKGTEVEVYSAGSEASVLAKSVNDAIVNCLGTVDRGIRERPGLYVLKMTDMPAILVELAFIDNDEDCDKLINRASDFAASTAKGILKYLGQDIEVARNIAPNGKPYEQNDIDYLINQGYSMAATLSMLDATDKYSKSSIGKGVEWANAKVGSIGYGNNGCTAFVRDFLISSDHNLGWMMKDGSQGNLMWVPNLMDWAKENNLWKEPGEGGAQGDVCLLETNYCRSDGPDHVVIADGEGGYWGNSSSRNQIVKSDIARDYGPENVWGYIATGTGESKSLDVNQHCERSAEDIVGDAGSSSYVNLAPNGRVYEENDIKYLTNQGYTIEQAIEMLSKDDKYTNPLRKAPNGSYYEDNDVRYLTNNGYTLDAAFALLSVSDKYMKKA